MTLTATYRCSQCRVAMPSEDYLAHVPMCVADERTTIKWLKARHDPQHPRERRDWTRLENAAVVIALSLLGLNVVAVIAWLTADWWWQ